MLLAVLVSAVGSLASAQEPPPSETVNALQAVALSGDTNAAAILVDKLADRAIPIDQWQRDFKTYFQTGVFTESLGYFWQSAIENAADDQRQRFIVVSCFCASRAAGAALLTAPTLSAAFDSLATALRWLQHAGPALTFESRAIIFKELVAAFGKEKLGAFARDPLRVPFYVQSALTLAEYAPNDSPGRDALAAMLQLQGGALAIWRAHGILLFDNNALSQHHIGSLDSLLRSIPWELHAIRAIIVPDSTGLGSGIRFITSGHIIYLPYYAMNVSTSPHEFIDNGGPVAPMFTMTAAQEIVRSVQAVQFVKRPDLAARRDIILANAQLHSARYLRHYRMIAPHTYINNPDELLPSLAYIYFIDSRTVFEMAAAFFALKEQEAMDQYLLLADLLSGGQGTSYLFVTAHDGTVTRAPAQIGRIHGTWIRTPHYGDVTRQQYDLAANLWFCNSISFAGRSYVFEFNEYGITTRFLSR